MVKFENIISLDLLKDSKDLLVPHIFSQNYFQILKAKLEGKKLNNNERYYYSHFIKKKLTAMTALLGIDTEIYVNGKEHIRKDRLKQAVNILKKYSRKHRNKKILLAGSFLYKAQYRDIDIFVISKYNKEDYRDGKIQINFLPEDIENTLFFRSISAISLANFCCPKTSPEEDIVPSELLDLYERTILHILQDEDFLQELRDFVLKAEYAANHVVLDSLQLKKVTDKIRKSKNKIRIISKYLLITLIKAYSSSSLKMMLKKYLQKNSKPEKGRKTYRNWQIYNSTYQEVLEIVA